jgi:hypothetical protein
MEISRDFYDLTKHLTREEFFSWMDFFTARAAKPAAGSAWSFKTGAKKWQTRGKGSLTYADGHLYCLDERGTMALVKATPEEWTQVSSFRMPRGGEGAHWAHPVVCGGRLYLRHSDQLFAYDIRERLIS